MSLETKPVFDIIIPTWNNEFYLNPCVNSIIRTGVLGSGMAHLFIVNNGSQPCSEHFKDVRGITVLNSPRKDVGEPENLGWEGGLKLGLSHSTAEFVCFQNDDTFIPPTSFNMYTHLLHPFHDKTVGIVGPCTTVAAGIQSIFHPYAARFLTQSRYVIFFTAMVRRSYLDELGGVDDTLPGGDDIDLSIRMRKSGYKVLVNPDAFLIHHGFKTGERVRGNSSTSGGWNSLQMTEATNAALIRKHGFRAFFETWTGINFVEAKEAEDTEGNLIRSLVLPGEKVLELGCGFRKTVEDSVGVDRVPRGSIVPVYHGIMKESVAEVVADVTKPLPFEHDSVDVIIARHILEHCVDLVETVLSWKRYLRPGGRLIIALPDQEIGSTIPMDPTHVHAFTKSSLSSLMKLLGFAETSLIDTNNGISFIGVFKKLDHRFSLDRMYDGDITTVPLVSVT